MFDTDISMVRIDRNYIYTRLINANIMIPMESYRERHFIVNLWLWLVVLTYTIISVYNVYLLISNQGNNTIVICLGALSILTLSKVLGTLLLIKWNRYGCYLFCLCSCVIDVIIISILKQHIAFGILEILIALITCGILQIRKNDISAWKYMEDGWDYKHCRHIYQMFGLFVILLTFLTCICAFLHRKKTSSSQDALSDSLIYARAVEKLDSDENFESGVTTLDSLAEKGMPEAMYKMAYLYMWIPNDSQNALYKNRMGIATENTGDFKGMPQSESINRKAVKLLQDVVRVTDSTHIEAMYYLGFYYANGIVLPRDYYQARTLFEKAKSEANRTGNTKMFEKIESVLTNINEANYD